MITRSVAETVDDLDDFDPDDCADDYAVDEVEAPALRSRRRGTNARRGERLKAQTAEVERQRWRPDVRTCALDVADRGGVTLEVAGDAMDLTRERARQIEVSAALRMRTSLRRTYPER